MTKFDGGELEKFVENTTLPQVTNDVLLVRF